MVVLEYRVVMPFTLDEFRRGFRYTCARQSQEVLASSANGERVARQEDGRFTVVPDPVKMYGRVPARSTLCNEGTYIRNRLYLGSRLPGWVRRLFPDAAFWIREEYWGAFPYSFCRYTSELWPHQLEFTIESLHVANDLGETDGVFADMSSKEQKECKTQVLDIGSASKNSMPGVFQGDPTSFRSTQCGRGPLSGPGWWRQSPSIAHVTESTLSNFALSRAMETRPLETEPPQDPLMCIYKRAQCKLHSLPFASRLEQIALDSTVRDMVVHGFKNLFCWTDCWFNLSHSDLNRLEDNTRLQLSN